MMTIHMGAAGSVAAGKAMAAYLLEQQVPAEALRSAEYYARTEGIEVAIAQGHGAAPQVRVDINPALADVLGITQGRALNAAALGMILAGRDADGNALPIQEPHRETRTYGKKAEDGESTTKIRHRVAYVGLTFSAPKSLSVAWAFARTEGERNSLLQAHRTARDEALAYVEQQIIRVRLGAGGRGGTERGRAAWITVDHYTARPTIETTAVDPATGETMTMLINMETNGRKVPGDPALHTHVLIPNIVVTEDGKLGSIDTAAFHGRIKEFGAVYHDILARELRAMGVAVEMDPKTMLSRLPAIPQHVCDEFSKRTRDAEEAAKLWAKADGQDWDTMTPDERAASSKVGANMTRRDKETNDPDMDAWQQQAKRLGWEHETVVGPAPTTPATTRAERMDMADHVGLQHLADMLTQRAVIGQGDARLAAARGFLVAGIEGTDDIGAMMKHWASGSVLQDGQWTKLLWATDERGEVRITTELHRDQELELIALAQRAVTDRRLSFSPGEIEHAIRTTGVEYTGSHGDAQRHAVQTLGTDGGLGVMVGVGGAGKTKGVLPPIVAAAEQRGLEVWGVAQGWKQARELTGAGIAQDHTKALQPFLDGVHEGRIKLRPDSVVVLDELGQVGTRQLLDVLRLREAGGWKLIALGDDKQCSAIEAGPVIDLLRRALGEDRIPQILSTIRQQSEDEQRISLLFRDGQAKEAVQEKIANGTAELVPGGYRNAVERVAAIYAEQRAAGFEVTISAPTNIDAREISLAVRAVRRDMGEVGREEIKLDVTDGRGTNSSMDLALGDRVRLFAATRGTFTGADGRRRGNLAVGDNGSVVTVVGIDRHEGLRLQTASGKTGFVPWANLRDRQGSGRILLAYGDVLTIDSAQGMTAQKHIDALVSGSSSTNRGKAYVAESRHVVQSFLIASEGAEMREVRTRRMSGLPAQSQAEERQAAWGNLVRNLTREVRKDSALELLERTGAVRRQSAKMLQGAMRRHQAREQAGLAPTNVEEVATEREVRAALPAIAAGIQAVAMVQEARWAPVVDPLTADQRAIHGLQPKSALPPEIELHVTLLAVTAKMPKTVAMVAAGYLPEDMALEGMMKRAHAAAVAFPGIGERMPELERLMEQRLTQAIARARFHIEAVPEAARDVLTLERWVAADVRATAQDVATVASAAAVPRQGVGAAQGSS